MDDTRGAPVGGHPQDRPEPPARPAAAFAPPPRSRRALVLFVASLVLVVCAVAGVLFLFTAQPVRYAALLLALAAAAAVALVLTLRTKPRDERR